MKNFEDFQLSITQSQLNEWSDEIIQYLNLRMKDEDYQDPEYFSIAFNRSYYTKLFMKMLEEYHKWLHEE